jgi:hypothetical protein
MLISVIYFMLLQCAKALGDDNEVALLTNKRALLKKHTETTSEHHNLVTLPLKLEREAIQCRMMARKFVLDKQKQPADDKLKKSLEKLTVEINNTSDIEMKEAVSTFQEHVLQQIDNPNMDERRTVILKACNDIR